MKKNLVLKAAIVGRFGSQFRGSRKLCIAESRLSRIVNGYIIPNEVELRRLRKALGNEAIAAFDQIDAARANSADQGEAAKEVYFGGGRAAVGKQC